MSRQLCPQFLQPTSTSHLFLFFLYLFSPYFSMAVCVVNFFVLQIFLQLYAYLRNSALPFHFTIHDHVSCGGVWLLYPAPKFL